MTAATCPPDCAHFDADGHLVRDARMVRLDELLVDLPDVDDPATGIQIAKAVITERDVTMGMFSSAVGPARTPRAGDTYTTYHRNGRLWMSDTRAERGDHLAPANEIRWAAMRRLHPDRYPGDTSTGRVLIGGLGLGMITGFALRQPGVTVVDVVDNNADTLTVVGGLYQPVAEKHGVQLNLHHHDMLTMSWPRGSWWDVAWFDIWPTLCTDDLAEHGRLNRSYSRRTGWYACWGHELLLARRRQERVRWWR